MVQYVISSKWQFSTPSPTESKLLNRLPAKLSLDYVPEMTPISTSSVILTNLRDAYKGQSRSPSMVPFDMLGMVSY